MACNRCNSTDNVNDIYCKDSPLQQLGDEVSLCKKCTGDLKELIHVWWISIRNKQT